MMPPVILLIITFLKDIPHGMLLIRTANHAPLFKLHLPEK